jgi:hypothetical protein
VRFLVLFFLFLTTSVRSQSLQETEGKGTGLTKSDAMQDALRNAVSQSAGVSILSETKVENYLIVSDAISSNIKGYIQSYEVIKETPFPDRFEVVVKAKVTTETIKADFQLLARQIGGMRFLVMPDPKETNEANLATLQIVSNKINEALSAKGCRYIERERFNSLKKETMALMEASNTEKLSYAQQLGMLSDAQFILTVSDVQKTSQQGAFDISKGDKYSFNVKVVDNCTGEGLGSLSFASMQASKNIEDAIGKAVNEKFEKLFGTITSYIGSWLNNGTPYELRFYQTGTYRDFRDLRKKLKEDASFGGEMEITSVLNYTKLNCTFKKRADDLADKLLDLADEIPTFKEQKLDVKHIFGRQISIAPQKYIIPNLPIKSLDSNQTQIQH